MNAWWRGLSPRERLLVRAGAGVLAVLIALQFIAAPLFGWREGATARAEGAERSYQLVARAAAAAPGSAAATADLSTPVRNALNEAAQRNQVGLTFVNAIADGSVAIQAGPAPPERVFALFADLERRYAISVVSADIAREADDPGSVRLQATLAR